MQVNACLRLIQIQVKLQCNEHCTSNTGYTNIRSSTFTQTRIHIIQCKKLVLDEAEESFGDRVHKSYAGE